MTERDFFVGFLYAEVGTIPIIFKSFLARFTEFKEMKCINTFEMNILRLDFPHSKHVE